MKNKTLNRTLYLLVVVIAIVGLTGCSAGGGSGDAPSAEASAEPVEMSDVTTGLGQKIQSNGYDYDSGWMDQTFSETLKCIGVTDVPADIYIVLKEPYSAFPCVPLPGGCGGLFDLDNGEPIITVTADFVRLKHEYIHYMLYYSTGDPDSGHDLDLYDSCA